MILNAALILVAVFMGLKQGYAMFSGKREMIEMFSKWNFSKTAVMINGAVTIIGALLILFPKNICMGQFYYGSWYFNDYLPSVIKQRFERCNNRTSVFTAQSNYYLLTVSTF